MVKTMIGMPRKTVILTVMLAALTLANCTSKQVTKGERFPHMYVEVPASILILPPTNESAVADAKIYYVTTIQECLSDWGYYIFPYEISSDILKSWGIYDSDLTKDMPLAKFHEHFGADAVLFTTIEKWDVSYLVIASNLTIAIDCKLMSTKTNRQLWKYNGTIVIDLSGRVRIGPVGLLVKTVVGAVKIAIGDYVPYVKQVNYSFLWSLPFGKYHQQYLGDQGLRFSDQAP
jgi:hypothetical protein